MATGDVAWSLQDYDWNPSTLLARPRPAGVGPADSPREAQEGSRPEGLVNEEGTLAMQLLHTPQFLNKLPVLVNHKTKLQNMRNGSPPVCLVEGCGQPLEGLKRYFLRVRVCKQHLNAPAIVVDGALSRFCQQCGRFQFLNEFTAGKKSCTATLERHNERHRQKAATKQQQGGAGGADGPDVCGLQHQQGKADDMAAGQGPRTSSGSLSAASGTALANSQQPASSSWNAHPALAAGLAMGNSVASIATRPSVGSEDTAGLPSGGMSVGGLAGSNGSGSPKTLTGTFAPQRVVTTAANGFSLRPPLPGGKPPAQAAASTWQSGGAGASMQYPAPPGMAPELRNVLSAAAPLLHGAAPPGATPLGGFGDGAGVQSQSGSPEFYPLTNDLQQAQAQVLYHAAGRSGAWPPGRCTQGSISPAASSGTLVAPAASGGSADRGALTPPGAGTSGGASCGAQPDSPSDQGSHLAAAGMGAAAGCSADSNMLPAGGGSGTLEPDGGRRLDSAAVRLNSLMSELQPLLAHLRDQVQGGTDAREGMAAVPHLMRAAMSMVEEATQVASVLQAEQAGGGQAPAELAVFQQQHAAWQGVAAAAASFGNGNGMWPPSGRIKTQASGDSSAVPEWGRLAHQHAVGSSLGANAADGNGAPTQQQQYQAGTPSSSGHNPGATMVLFANGGHDRSFSHQQPQPYPQQPQPNNFVPLLQQQQQSYNGGWPQQQPAADGFGGRGSMAPMLGNGLVAPVPQVAEDDDEDMFMSLLNELAETDPDALGCEAAEVFLEQQHAAAWHAQQMTMRQLSSARLTPYGRAGPMQPFYQQQHYAQQQLQGWSPTQQEAAGSPTSWLPPASSAHGPVRVHAHGLAAPIQVGAAGAQQRPALVPALVSQRSGASGSNGMGQAQMLPSAQMPMQQQLQHMPSSGASAGIASPFAGGPAPYEGDEDMGGLTRVSLKVMGLLPHELPPQLKANLRKWMAEAQAEVAQATLRPGCVQLVLDVSLPPGHQRGRGGRSAALPLPGSSFDPAGEALAALLIPPGEADECAADVFRVLGQRLRDTTVQIGSRVLRVRVGSPPSALSWQDAAEEAGMPSAKLPLISGCSALAVVAGAATRLRLHGSHLRQAGARAWARANGHDLQLTMCAPEAAGQQGGAAPSEADDTDVVVRVPRGASGVVTLEVGAGHLLGGWWHVALVPSEPVAQELNALAQLPVGGEEAAAAAWQRGLRRLVVDLGQVLALHEALAAHHAAAEAAAAAALGGPLQSEGSGSSAGNSPMGAGDAHHGRSTSPGDSTRTSSAAPDASWAGTMSSTMQGSTRNSTVLTSGSHPTIPHHHSAGANGHAAVLGGRGGGTASLPPAPTAAAQRQGLVKATRLLYFAVERGMASLTALLLSVCQSLAGGNSEVLEAAGVVPQLLLHPAVASGSMGTVDALVAVAERDMGMQLRLDEPGPLMGMTPLHVAAVLGDGGVMACHLLSTHCWAPWLWLCATWQLPASGNGAANGLPCEAGSAAAEAVLLTPGALALRLGLREPLELALRRITRSGATAALAPGGPAAAALLSALQYWQAAGQVLMGALTQQLRLL